MNNSGKWFGVMIHEPTFAPWIASTLFATLAEAEAELKRIEKKRLHGRGECRIALVCNTRNQR